jgi:GNAT superfamily N-acetyltransferase
VSPTYQSRELSEKTWPDFEKLFSGGHGWDFCWCIAFHRIERATRTEFRTRAEVAVPNHRDKQALVQTGRAQGMLVYADGEPVGWCQYGSAGELHGRSNSAPAPDSSQRVWRITCFVVDPKHRRRGVASLALHAALASIESQGGGIVEAYPVSHWTHGRHGSEGVRFVQGVGPVAPAWGGFNNVSYSGTVSMFEKEGFEAVAVCKSGTSRRIESLGADGCYVLMRKLI